MEFYDWPAESSQGYIPDLLVLSVPGVETDKNAVLWNNHTWNEFNDFSPNPNSNYFFDSSGSSRSTSDASLCQLAAIDDNNTNNSKTIDGQAAAISSKRDPTATRIQRRRAQNRISQQVYRQRQIEERALFEKRAIAAEETSSQMEGHLRTLQLMVTSLGQKIHKLEAENLALRRSMY